MQSHRQTRSAHPAKKAQGPLCHVDLLLHEHADAGSAFMLVDQLRAANLIVALRHGETARAPFAWCLRDAQARPLALPSVLAGHAGAPSPVAGRHAVFVPPIHARNVPAIRQLSKALTAHVAWLRQARAEGADVLMLGTGAWLAARAGLIGQRRITLPWPFIAGFRHDHPEVALAEAEPCCVDGPVFSAAQVDALPELAHRLIERVGGPELGRSWSDAFLFQAQRQTITARMSRDEQLPPTRDSVLARAIEWMDDHLDERYRLAALAEAAAVSPRTLLRHFRRVLGVSPLEHLHRLRCERATVLLQITLHDIPQIAEACGYAEPAAFRRVFARHVGMSPSQYRARYALRAGRDRWQVETREAIRPGAPAPAGHAASRPAA